MTQAEFDDLESLSWEGREEGQQLERKFQALNVIAAPPGTVYAILDDTPTGKMAIYCSPVPFIVLARVFYRYQKTKKIEFESNLLLPWSLDSEDGVHNLMFGDNYLGMAASEAEAQEKWARRLKP